MVHGYKKKKWRKKVESIVCTKNSKQWNSIIKINVKKKDKEEDFTIKTVIFFF